MPGAVKTAVVTGHHPFDVLAFHQLFRSLADVDAYVQPLEDFTASSPETRAAYDAVVFYNMHQETPGETGEWHTGNVKAALEGLGETRQGIVMLHHAILAFPKWPLWGKIVGLKYNAQDFSYHFDQTVQTQIVDTDHPITRGLQPWEMVDETYKMADADEDSEILLTYEHPLSMKTIAWTRQHGNSRVFCYEAGHDSRTYAAAGFREVLRRGILWTAGRI